MSITRGIALAVGAFFSNLCFTFERSGLGFSCAFFLPTSKVHESFPSKVQLMMMMMRRSHLLSLLVIEWKYCASISPIPFSLSLLLSWLLSFFKKKLTTILLHLTNELALYTGGGNLLMKIQMMRSTWTRHFLTSCELALQAFTHIISAMAPRRERERRSRSRSRSRSHKEGGERKESRRGAHPPPPLPEEANEERRKKRGAHPPPRPEKEEGSSRRGAHPPPRQSDRGAERVVDKGGGASEEGEASEEREEGEQGEEGEEEEEEEGGEEGEMKKLMGFTGFASSQGKGKAAGEAKLSAAKKRSTRQGRQYMNRINGFNRPLPKERTGEIVNRQ